MANDDLHKIHTLGTPKPSELPNFEIPPPPFPASTTYELYEVKALLREIRKLLVEKLEVQDRRIAELEVELRSKRDDWK